MTTSPCQLEFSLFDGEKPLLKQTLESKHQQTIAVGKHAYIHLVSINPSEPLPNGKPLGYNFGFTFEGQSHSRSLLELAPHLSYRNNSLPSFVITSSLQRILHGSCRKPHHDSQDGLVRVDHEIEQALSGENTVITRPELLLMTGDQVYADDVAGPMLVAIHQVIELLGLHEESWQGAVANNSEALYQHEYCYYQRDQLLPHTKANKAVYEKFFAASKKPIFTSVNAKNHLVTFAECIAMYLLVWSPSLWSLVDLSKHKVTEKYHKKYLQELTVIENFNQSLPAVQRALAHIPTYMIFDDHDITDDWNLTRGWEEAAYGHPFSKQIIGNTLIAYWLCQGWGNAPDKFTDFNLQNSHHISENGLAEQDALIDKLFAWQDWHYSLATTPKVVVLDTRTQRWRSESRASKPSGLMDWEALSALQQELINEPRVIMVSPAPVYGVKMIETIQRIFTFFGQPLMVDAENWMAHSGTANVMLNIFRHVKTPPEFIILSGDVHYSFVYDVTHRFRRSRSKIIQVTSSGIKNQFPAGLLRWLDSMNRVLYATYSPLNWFTKRRRMKIRVRKPQGLEKSTLLNGSGIGEIILTNDDNIVQVNGLMADHRNVEFIAKKDLD